MVNNLMRLLENGVGSILRLNRYVTKQFDAKEVDEVYFPPHAASTLTQLMEHWHYSLIELNRHALAKDSIYIFAI